MKYDASEIIVRSGWIGFILEIIPYMQNSKSKYHLGIFHLMYYHQEKHSKQKGKKSNLDPLAACGITGGMHRLNLSRMSLLR